MAHYLGHCRGATRGSTMSGIPQLGAVAIIVLVVACGGGASPATVPAATLVETASLEPPLWRYVNSGWVSPHDVPAAEVFTGQLRAYVITSEEELDTFQRSIVVKRSRGTTTSLGRVKFPGSVPFGRLLLVAARSGRPPYR